ncbi:MAG: peptidoglycan DD-metalloendopeptidase family protein [Methyloceanibacter sp.]
MRRAMCLAFGRGAIRVLAAGSLAFAIAGCSSSSRFDYPALGLTGSNSTNADLTTTAALPVPEETVYSSDRYHHYGANNPAPGAQVSRSALPPPRATPAAYSPAPAAPKPPAYEETRAPRPEPAVIRATQAQGPGFRVTVGQGDTLASLSKRYAVPVEAIVSANGLPDARLAVGQELLIPTGGAKAKAAAPASVSVAPGENTYKVEPGDTMNSISQKLGVSPKALVDRNNIRPHQLQIGQMLVVPTADGASAGQESPSVRTVKTTTIPAPGDAPSSASASGEQSQLARVDQLPSPDPMSGNSFRWPVKGRITAGFGPRPDGSHNDGINVQVPQGTSVKAAENGVVAYSGNELKGYGNLVLIRHANNWVSAYAHNQELLVKRGDKVRRGEIIAKAGATGSVSQPQVHFELRKGSRPVDPTKYMSSATAANDD